MCVACDYTIHRRDHHYGWSRDFTPAAVAKSGSTVHFECLDSSGGQLGTGSTVADVVNLDFAKVNPVTGPVYVEGAEPGDVLKVEIREFVPSGIGWTAVIPGFGLLADQFTDPALEVGHLVDQALQRLGVDVAGVDPFLVPAAAFAHRVQVGLGAALVELGIGHGRVGRRQLVVDGGKLRLQAQHLGVLGQVLAPVGELHQHRVDLREVQQSALRVLGCLHRHRPPLFRCGSPL